MLLMYSTLFRIAGIGFGDFLFVLVFDRQEAIVILEGQLGQEVPDIALALAPGDIVHTLFDTKIAAVFEVAIQDPALEEFERFAGVDEAAHPVSAVGAGADARRRAP